jgi:hypothetical protein
MITKQQFDRFNEHFVVREAVTINADFDLKPAFDEIQSALQNMKSDTFFQDSNWEETYSETTNSDGYAIYHRDTDSFIQPVSHLDDIIEFIEEQMDECIQDMENND